MINRKNSLLELADSKMSAHLQMLRVIEQELKDAPEGCLRISHKKTHDEYYVNAFSSNSTGYLRKGQHELAYAIAKRDYLMDIRKIIMSDLKVFKMIRKSLILWPSQRHMKSFRRADGDS